MTGEKVRYICPVCDHEMRPGSHYCLACRSWIREPWKFTGGHLPNENHGDCHPSVSYLKPRENGQSSSLRQYRIKEGKYQGLFSQVQKTQPVRPNVPRNSGYGSRPAKKKENTSSFGVILFLIILLFWFFRLFG